MADFTCMMKSAIALLYSYIYARPTKKPFDPYKEISESVHRAALDVAFANGNISSYDEYLERLKGIYGIRD